MTPFSNKLRSLRESRGILQKSLAVSLTVGATYLSALEQGRKPPPHNKEFFVALRAHLQLTEYETDELLRLAKATEILGPMANGTSPMQLDVAAQFASRLTVLEPRQLRAIQSILEMTDPPCKAMT
jgi:HTH-type transcriptional regulator, competence development regulator